MIPWNIKPLCACNMQYVVCGMQYVVCMVNPGIVKRIESGNIIVTSKGCTCRALLKVSIEATVLYTQKLIPW